MLEKYASSLCRITEEKLFFREVELYLKMSQNPAIDPSEPLRFNPNAGGKCKPQHASAKSSFFYRYSFFSNFKKSRFLLESLKIQKFQPDSKKSGFLGILD